MASLGKIALASLPLLALAPRAAVAQDLSDASRAMVPLFDEPGGLARLSGKLSLAVAPLGGDAAIEALRAELAACVDDVTLRLSLGESVVTAPALSAPSTSLGLGLSLDEAGLAIAGELALDEPAAALRLNLTY